MTTTPLPTVLLTHPCGAVVRLTSSTWTTPRGTPLSHCDGCGEWLGTPFIRAEQPEPRCTTSRPRVHR